MWRHWMKKVQTQVSSLFYTHGLFCASHPVAIIALVICVVLLLCYPLTTLPLPGNAPLELMTPLEGYTIPPTTLPKSPTPAKDDVKRPRWYQGAPLAYIKQIVIKAVVSPWQPNKMARNDAYRGPLLKAFDITEKVNQFHMKDKNNESLSITNMCLHVPETLSLKKVKGLVPEYNCLVISPANFWGQDRDRFLTDGEIIKTIYKKYGQALDAPPSIRDILFGIPLKDTGVKRFYIRNRQRVISYAVSIVLKEYNKELLDGLESKLLQMYPVSPAPNLSAVPDLAHYYFQNVNYFVEYTPLLVTYVVLFMYIYFSVSKIEMVKSKWGLAFSAVVTVICSLLTSIGLCTMFGLTPSLNGSEIFPYLVVIIGLENVLVVTKSVVSTPVHLDVKLRVAQGLSKEGWYIFKNLVAELFILFVGFFTFVPAIQEFCLFAVVGLLSDFFLQMFFFATVLSIDLRRMELSDLQKQSVQKALHESSSDSLPSHPALNRCPVMNRFSVPPPPRPGRLPRSKSDPRLPVPEQPVTPALPTPQPTPSPTSPAYDDMFFPEKIWRTPRRVRFMNYWARTRMMQRGIMVCVVIWIGLIVYKTGLVEYVAYTTELVKPDHTPHAPLPHSVGHNQHFTAADGLEEDDHQGRHHANGGTDVTGDWTQLQHDNLEQWRDLSYMHWPTLLGYYNFSTSGRYITILPSTHLSLTISPEDAISMRHPDEEPLAPPDEPISPQIEHAEGHHLKDSHIGTELPYTGHPHLDIAVVMQKLVRYPRTRKELISTVLLGIASTILLIYSMTKLYQCMCSRNYAKWRSSWSKNKRQRIKHSPYYKQIRESVPLLLEGHMQEVECVVTDGPLVVSSCLGGQLRVWDSSSGECYTTIQRKGASPPVQRRSIPGRNIDDSDADLYAEYHELKAVIREQTLPTNSSKRASYPSKGEGRSSGHREAHQHHTRHRSVDFADLLPDLSSAIDTDFSNIYKFAAPQKVMSSQSNAYRHSAADNVSAAASVSPAPSLSSLSSTPPLSTPVSSSIPIAISPISSTIPISMSIGGPVVPPISQSGSPVVPPISQSASPVVHPISQSASPVLSPAQVSLSQSISQQFVSQSQNIAQVQSQSCENIPELSLNQNDITAAGSQTLPPTTTCSAGIYGHRRHKSYGFDFSKFNAFYDEHSQMMKEKEDYLRKRNKQFESVDKSGSSSLDRSREEDEVAGVTAGHQSEEDPSRTRNSSQGDDVKSTHSGSSWGDVEFNDDVVPAIWTLACQDNLVVAGCANGRIEFWDGLSGALKCIFHESKVGATAICFVSNRVIVARLNGQVDFLELETFARNAPLPPMSTLYNRGQFHRLQSSPGGTGDMKTWDDVIHITQLSTTRAHQRPINALQSEGGRTVTASQDHTLKVFRLEDSLCLYTLHGHSGGVTALYLDQGAPLAAASGSEDGTVRLWDLLTGGCVHKLEGHYGTVVSLTCTPMYVVSTGMDDRLCIWERCKGHLLHWIQMEPGYCNNVAMLTSNLMVTGGQGCIYLWDVSKGHALRAVQLGDNDHSIFVRQLHVINNSTVVCDYGNQLRVIHFPAVLEKAD